MRAYKDMTGAVFDVSEEDIERIEDIFNHLKEERRIDFDIGRAKQLPELKEDENFGGYQGNYNQGYGNSGGFRGGYQKPAYQNYQSGGYNTRAHDRQGGTGGSAAEARTVFVGNLGFDSKDKDI